MSLRAEQDGDTVINYIVQDGSIFFWGWNEALFEGYHTARMTVSSPSRRHPLDKETGELAENVKILVDGETVSIPWEEYVQRYDRPTIRPIVTTAQDILDSDPLWSSQLEYNEINYHAFPVIGVEKLSYVANFAQQICRITQGRDFTREEVEQGKPVCVISQQMAQRNGVQVGDTVDIQFFSQDESIPYQSHLRSGKGTIMPNAYFFNQNTQLQEKISYTVVGIYRQDNAWEDVRQNNYAFSPNTVFVPQSSHQSSKLYADQGIFRTVILKNGAVEEFDAIINQHDFPNPIIPADEQKPEVMIYHDQGYRQVKNSFTDYRELADQVQQVGMLVYAIILLLFMLLYPGSLGKRLRTMASLGTPRKQKMLHILFTSWGILIPGTVLGTVFSMVLWGPVVSRLLVSGKARFGLGIDIGTLVIISLVQLVIATALVLLLAIPMTRHKDLMKRK